MTKNLLLLVLVWWIISSFKPEAIIYTVPEEYTPDFIDYSLDPSIHTQLHIGDNGTILHVPEDAFVDLDGNVVEGKVTLKFKEYTNAAEIAFSNIPMTYKGNNFNSSGMFEIQGNANGEPIRIAEGKSLSIDYKLVKDNPNTDFYRLNERNNQWELVSTIPQLANPLTVVKPNEIVTSAPNKKPINRNIITSIPDDIVLKETENQSRNYNNNIIRNNRNIDRQFNSRTTKAKKFQVNKWQGLDQNVITETISANQTKGQKLYSSIINGLRIGGFGVYNCDQVYRIENRVDVIASYQDSKGNPIPDLYTLSLLNLDYNNAMSFSPGRFSCDTKGNNVLLLFDLEGDLYLLDKGMFGKMKIKENGEYTFTVKKVSDKIKNTTDLAKHLGIS